MGTPKKHLREEVIFSIITTFWFTAFSLNEVDICVNYFQQQSRWQQIWILFMWPLTSHYVFTLGHCNWNLHSAWHLRKLIMCVHVKYFQNTSKHGWIPAPTYLFASLADLPPGQEVTYGTILIHSHWHFSQCFVTTVGTEYLLNICCNPVK